MTAGVGLGHAHIAKPHGSVVQLCLSYPSLSRAFPTAPNLPYTTIIARPFDRVIVSNSWEHRPLGNTTSDHSRVSLYTYPGAKLQERHTLFLDSLTLSCVFPCRVSPAGLRVVQALGLLCLLFVLRRGTADVLGGCYTSFRASVRRGL